MRDDAYLEVFEKFSKNNHLTIHTSGSLVSKSLGIISNRWGCIYPLQSIKKDSKVSWEKVPFFIEAANEKDEKLLSIFCASNNMNFSILNSFKRKKLHLAAVASNNFTYHLLSTVKEYCIKNEVDFKNLKFLLEKTIETVLNKDSYMEQTGPAKRGDNTLIEEQEKELKKSLKTFKKFTRFSQNKLLKNTTMSYKQKLSEINTFIFDVDGVLTDGNVILDSSGELLRTMHTKDGYALQHAVKKGYHIVIITGGNSIMVEKRLNGLGIKDIYLAAHQKLPILENHLKENKIKLNQVLYMGDDLTDIPCLKSCRNIYLS